MSAVLKLQPAEEEPGHGGGDTGNTDPFFAACAFLLAAQGRMPSGAIVPIARSLLAGMGAPAEAINRMESLIVDLGPVVDDVAAAGVRVRNKPVPLRPAP